jgi:pimeloyl-ACP methyl ester carboxylesterase
MRRDAMIPRQDRCLGLSSAGFHHIAFLGWGDPTPDGNVTICVHGLTRNSHDFDMLAPALAADGRHVVCPDIVGRGASDWLGNPADYSYPQYLSDMTALIARLQASSIDWIGTSMGGLIGMLLAAQPNTPIRRLVLNDIGPFISKQALQRIADYVGLDYRFSSVEALERHLRKIHAPFGPLSDDQWAHMARHGHRALPDGNYGLAYDPHIADNVKLAIADVDLWAFWDRITCPVLLLRGADSDILSPETAQAMTERGPRAELVSLSDVGHAPALMSGDQIDTIRSWLAHNR